MFPYKQLGAFTMIDLLLFPLGSCVSSLSQRNFGYTLSIVYLLVFVVSDVGPFIQTFEGDQNSCT